MKNKMFKLLLTVLMLVGFAVNGVADPQSNGPVKPQIFDRPPSKEQMEKIRQRIDTLRMWELTKALNLDEKTSAKLFPLLNQYDKKKFTLGQKMMDGMGDLTRYLKEKNDNDLKKTLIGLEQTHREMDKINDNEFNALKNILTIEQQAQFVLFKMKFEREIGRLMEESRQGPGHQPMQDDGNRPLPPPPLP